MAGTPLGEAKKALILLHGRGGSADDILSIASYLNTEGFALLAPQATGNSWYPYSFLVPPANNQPGLNDALALIGKTVDLITNSGIPASNIYLSGFSQGACLTLEYVARNATRYGGVAAFTGGLIGDKLYTENYKGDFAGTPIFIGTSNPDPHVPVERVNASAAQLEQMQAAVTKKVYPNMGHTITQDEIDVVNNLLFKPQLV